MKKHLIFLILVSLIALWPFFKKGFFQSHDGEWMIIRFTAFHQTLAAGQLPVRFVDRLNNNYGYPVLNFLYPLPFYLSEIPKVLGFNFVDSIKATFVLSAVFSVAAMYWALSQTFSPLSSLVGAITYLYIPYRFVDLYVRGSLGESLAFAVIPLIFGFIYKLKKHKDIFLPPLAISIGLLILSHNVIAVLFIPTLLIIALIIVKSKIKAALSFLAGITIASFFWIPAIYDLKFVKLSQIKVSQVADHLVNLKDLFIPRWGFGPAPQSADGLSVQIGLVPTIIIAAAICFLIKNKEKPKIALFLIAITLSAIFLMTKMSLWFWQHAPLVDIIQFPWRLLSLVVFAVSILTAELITFTKNNTVVAFLIIVASFLTTIAYTKPAIFIDRPDGFYSTNEDTTTVKDEFMPLWVKEIPKERANQKIEIEGYGEIISPEIKAANYKVGIIAHKDIKVRVNTIYFPGWQATVDGQGTNILYNDNPNGLMSFKLPEGGHEVIIKYSKTPAHLASEVISLLALVGTGYYFFYLWRKQKTA